MQVKITTKFTLDPSHPLGRKNLNLILLSAGLRSQIEVRSVQVAANGWELILILERPEFWGNNLALLQQDLSTLVVFHNGVPEHATGLFKMEEH